MLSSGGPDESLNIYIYIYMYSEMQMFYYIANTAFNSKNVLRPRNLICNSYIQIMDDFV